MQQLQLQLTSNTTPAAETMAAVFGAPGAGGRRGALPQHLVFLTADHLLDLQVDYSEQVTVVGQIVNKAYCAVPDATVQAVSEHGVLVSAVTGSGGEFHVACRPRGAIKVRIAVSDSLWIELPLPRQEDVH